MSAVPTYAPRPGGVPERALAYLRDDLPKGGEISNAALAEALRVGSQVLVACLQPARAAGVVFARQKGGHTRSPLFWSLVDHGEQKPSFPGAGAPAVDMEPAAEPAPARPMQASPVVLAEPRLEDGEQPHDAEPLTPPEAPPMTAGGMRIALWSDGSLEIERTRPSEEPEILLFTRTEARQLVHYLDSIALDLVREGGA